MKKYVIGSAILIVFIIAFHSTLSVGLTGIENQLAAVIMSHNDKTLADIQHDYNSADTSLALGSSQPKVRILLVPGHEPDFGGATYKNLKERDMTVQLEQDLQKELEADGHYQVFTTRDTEAWTPTFAAYFQNNWNAIIAWDKANQADFSHLVSVGAAPEPSSTVYHNTVPDDVALRLYGITKWADENNIDITIHIHFNDDDRANHSKPGKYSGFAIYVPAPEYGNSTSTKVIADSIFKALASTTKVSNLPGELSGIVSEPDLIAIGPNDTADAASMLIEYSYIYEPQFQATSSRNAAIQKLADDTYQGLENFFEPSDSN